MKKIERKDRSIEKYDTITKQMRRDLNKEKGNYIRRV